MHRFIAKTDWSKLKSMNESLVKRMQSVDQVKIQ